MLSGWVRRRLVWYLKRDLVVKWKAKKIGKCAGCGKCCGICVAFDAKSKRCKIYKRRPAICKEFPLTPEDIKGMHNCGYRFRE